MISIKPSKKLIYLDYAATTPVRPEVVKIIQPFLAKNFGNPSSLHKAGVVARQAIASARNTAANVLRARPSEVVFTAGGSESINMAIFGVARKYRQEHKTGGHIITSQIEHHAVLRSVDQLQKEGFRVTKIKVDAEGFFNLDELKKSLQKDTVLVSLMYANNEIGTIEPIVEIGNIIAKYNASQPGQKALFHTDACQAAGFLELDVDRLGVDLLSINGSKIYGPKQTGCLYIRTGVSLQPLIFGGGQEKNTRGGTENVSGIVGFVKALELTHAERTKEPKRLSALRDYFISRIIKIIPGVLLNGAKDRRLPNNINLAFPNAEGEAIMFYLDSFNIAVSTGSACTSESTEPSHVLRAMGLSDARVKSSLRITLGKFTTKQELDYVLKVLPGVVRMVEGVEPL